MKSLILAGLSLAALGVIGCEHEHHDRASRGDYDDSRGYYDRDDQHHDYDARPSGGRIDRDRDSDRDRWEREHY